VLDDFVLGRYLYELAAKADSSQSSAAEVLETKVRG